MIIHAVQQCDHDWSSFRSNPRPLGVIHLIIDLRGDSFEFWICSLRTPDAEHCQSLWWLRPNHDWTSKVITAAIKGGKLYRLTFFTLHANYATIIPSSWLEGHLTALMWLQILRTNQSDQIWHFSSFTVPFRSQNLLQPQPEFQKREQMKKRRQRRKSDISKVDLTELRRKLERKWSTIYIIYYPLFI